MAKNQKTFILVLIALIVIIDQVIKIWVKTHLILGESIKITDWFYIFFVENSGMSFGISYETFWDLFRIIAVVAIGYYIYHRIKKGLKFGFTVAIAVIFAGALSNIINCVFYGVLFSSSMGQIAIFLPEGGGYASLFYGKVVNMLYFPLIDMTLPSWMPLIGGTSFTFFDPIFSFADLAVFVGVIMGMIFILKKNLESFNFEIEKNDIENTNLIVDTVEFVKEPHRNIFSGVFHIFFGYILLFIAAILVFTFFWFIGWIMLFVSLDIIFRGKQLMAISGNNAMKNKQLPIVLYLRPFNLDNYYTRNIHTFFVSIPFITKEMKFVKILKSKGSVIAIGKPGEKYASLGASRLYVEHHLWQEKVMNLIEDSKLILLVIGYSKSLVWELDYISKNTDPEKFYLYFPLSEYDTEDREKYWSLFLDSYAQHASNPFIKFPKFIDNITFFKFDKNWELTSISQSCRKGIVIRRFFEWSFFGLIIKSLLGSQHNRDCKLLKKIISQ